MPNIKPVMCYIILLCNMIMLLDYRIIAVKSVMEGILSDHS